MLNSDGYDSDLLLTHEQAARATMDEESEEYQAGYQRGYWFQSEESDSPDYIRGHCDGWNAHSLDRN
jgi:hypothetical protein